MLPFHFIRSRIGLYHRLIKITDTTLDVVISGFGCNSFTFTLRQKPRGVSRRQREPVLRRLRETPLGVFPQGYNERVSSRTCKYDIYCPIYHFY